MIRLVVMYNLPKDADEAAFLDWRVHHHQESNAAIPNVLRTDFARVVKAWPDDAKPRFRFCTILEWPDIESFESAFYSAQLQEELRENISRLGEYEYSICEVLALTVPVEEA